MTAQQTALRCRLWPATWIIRSYAGYPSMAFAVLLMNALTPIIDQYTRRGCSAARGQPLVFGKVDGRPAMTAATGNRGVTRHALILGFAWASAWCSR